MHSKSAKLLCLSASFLLPLSFPQPPLHLRDQVLQPLTRGVHQLQLVLDVALLRLRGQAGEVPLAVRRLYPRPDAHRPDRIFRRPKVHRRPRPHRGTRGGREGRGRRAEFVEVDGLVRGHRVKETQTEECHFVAAVTSVRRESSVDRRKGRGKFCVLRDYRSGH